jgi:uncharacterized protein YneF (UPF0154 family)
MVRTGRVWKLTLLAIGIIIILIGLGFQGYFVSVWKSFSSSLSELPALVGSIAEKIKQSPRQAAEEIGPAPEVKEEIPEKTEPKKYIEEAKKGEGITHLARRTLKEYLKENPQEPSLSPEHKVYIEDYLAKKMGGGWLQLGEKVEFSQELLKEAIQKAETLTPQQLENLTQFSQLVPSLNY